MPGWSSRATASASFWNRRSSSSPASSAGPDHLEGDGPVEADLPGLVDDAHAAAAQLAADLVVAEVADGGAGGQAVAIAAAAVGGGGRAGGGGGVIGGEVVVGDVGGRRGGLRVVAGVGPVRPGPSVASGPRTSPAASKATSSSSTRWRRDVVVATGGGQLASRAGPAGIARAAVMRALMSGLPALMGHLPRSRRPVVESDSIRPGPRGPVRRPMRRRRPDRPGSRGFLSTPPAASWPDPSGQSIAGLVGGEVATQMQRAGLRGRAALPRGSAPQSSTMTVNFARASATPELEAEPGEWTFISPPRLRIRRGGLVHCAFRSDPPAHATARRARNRRGTPQAGSYQTANDGVKQV